MRTIFKFLLIIFILLTICTCRKKTNIDVTVVDYALNEPVADAKVVLVERKESGLFSNNTSCNEIASAVTDANGNCSFDKEKLKTRSIYQYFIAITESYGHAQTYPCGGKTSGFLKLGKTNSEILEVGIVPAYFIVQYNNLLNPSQTGDSLEIRIHNPEYTVPGSQYARGGGGVFIAFPYNNCPGFPFPSIFLTEKEKTDAGKNTVHIRKRKMGVVSTYVDTVKIYPYETKTIEINW